MVIAETPRFSAASVEPDHVVVLEGGQQLLAPFLGFGAAGGGHRGVASL